MLLATENQVGSRSNQGLGARTQALRAKVVDANGPRPDNTLIMSAPIKASPLQLHSASFLPVQVARLELTLAVASLKGIGVE